MLAAWLAVTAVGKLSGSRARGNNAISGSSTVDITDVSGDPLAPDNPVQDAKDVVNALNNAMGSRDEELL